MTTFKISTSPKNVGIAFGFYRLPLLDGFLAHFGILSLFLSHFPISTDPPPTKNGLQRIVYGSIDLKKNKVVAPKTTQQLPSNRRSPNPFFLSRLICILFLQESSIFRAPVKAHGPMPLLPKGESTEHHLI